MPDRSLFLVTLLVDDYDAAKSFYCDMLDFVCVEDQPLAKDKRWLVVKPSTSNGAALLLAEATTSAQKTALGRQSGDRVCFFLSTDNFERDYRAMVAKGVDFLEEPRHEAYGTVAVFRDPYGNKWDLIEHSDRSAS
ncbi:VOC family protein [Oryzifoliimicrobium ureilyticus]|uniref:VOC family protein n=1 Tax=Oryzifoliimicrobium ureilyticus TaxID=3113724 RepID=UPI0030766AA4